MNSKPLVWIGMFVGSAVGSFIPSFWGDSFISVWSILLSGVGGILGIWIGYRLSGIA